MKILALQNDRNRKRSVVTTSTSSLTSLQKNLCCLLYGPGKARFEHREVTPIEDPRDYLVRISYVGVCRSDAHFWTHGGVMRMVSDEKPLVMGHEASGIVHSVVPAVASVMPGDRVSIEPSFSYRRCKQCKARRYNLYAGMKFAADPPDNHGTLARLFRTPGDFVYKIPDSVSLEEAVLVEPFSVAVHGARLAGLAPGHVVLVQGSGNIGLLAAATAKAFDAKEVFVSDINQSKLDFAKSFVGCKTFMSDSNSSPQLEPVRMKKELGIDEGADVVLECTGVESSVQTGIYASGPGGVVVQIGLEKPYLTLPVLHMCEKEPVFKTAWRYAPGDYEVTLSFISSGRISVRSLISTIVPFEKAPDAWEMTKNGHGIKNLIQSVQDD
ncbi:NAD(P)-dependent alcohol dehydrogenase [Aspergillus affinis]|uniref:NAD(P)-dependent alcohol dehydrogenase n=1 Tax=Aspergillus affinis TaxID=1070780 RepID=UPI0022FEE8A9|nr:GroES-like protein [Aspergillus affinis]KAI9036495.1 GroES-like protein [Aspergillus affinis]